MLESVPASRRIQRHLSLVTGAPAAALKSFALRRFYPFVAGLERFSGRDVLEIGGTDRISLEHFFTSTGARYANVRLERNETKNPRIIEGDFMDVGGKFDLVISLGVFEPGALDIDFSAGKALRSSHTDLERAQKLFSLVNAGGFAVIGTINAPCVFDGALIRRAGFGILSRESPFYTFMFPDNAGIYAKGDRSELIILKKKDK
ncbi:MAG TPA: hypothetical protein VLD37_04790 [Candidatus Bilamarchaeum sp.]|nr:hypothetical protein [Candidatus Bilamarchaeum sp.]